MKKEIWKDVKNYKDIYQVSNYGMVKSLKRKRWSPHNNCFGIYKEIIIKQKITSSGYRMVTLYKNKIKKYYSVHRIVAQVFIPNPENKPQINHIDCNKQNNYYKNLEWTNASENQIHASKNGLMPIGENHWHTHLTKNDVFEIKKNKEKLNRHQLAKKYNISYGNLCKIVNNKAWKHI